MTRALVVGLLLIAAGPALLARGAYLMGRESMRADVERCPVRPEDFKR